MNDNFFEVVNNCTILKVRATTKASKNAITGIHNGMLCISVTSVPENGKANEAIIKILSKELKCAKTKISVTSGDKNRNKILKIEMPLDLNYLITEDKK